MSDTDDKPEVPPAYDPLEIRREHQAQQNSMLLDHVAITLAQSVKYTLGAYSTTGDDLARGYGRFFYHVSSPDVPGLDVSGVCSLLRQIAAVLGQEQALIEADRKAQQEAEAKPLPLEDE